MGKINVKEKNKEKEFKVGIFRLLLNIGWNADDDIETEWDNEPNRKVLEKTLNDVDKMEPKVEPTLIGKNGKSHKNRQLNKENLTIKKGPKIKGTQVNKMNKDRADEEREH